MHTAGATWQDSGWGMFHVPVKTGRLVEACLPLFMEMNMMTSDKNKVWILGIPFMRAYATTFNRATRTVGFAPLELGTSICTSCDPPTAPAVALAAVPAAAAATPTAAGGVLAAGGDGDAAARVGSRQPTDRALLPLIKRPSRDSDLLRPPPGQPPPLSATRRPISPPVLSYRNLLYPAWAARLPLAPGSPAAPAAGAPPAKDARRRVARIVTL